MLKMKNYLFLFFSCTAFYFANAQQSKLPGVKTVSFKKDSFNIINFGAVADGISINTKSINDAIIACHKNGGGVVIVPKGM